MVRPARDQIACVAGVERGRGRGNLGARESVQGRVTKPHQHLKVPAQSEELRGYHHLKEYHVLQLFY